MIILKNVSKLYRRLGVETRILDDVSLEVPTDRQIAILGTRASGKSTILHLLAGIEPTTKGKIERFARISLPIGYAKAFKPLLSCKENVTFLSRAYGAKVSEVMEFVREVSQITDVDFDLPMRAIRAEPRQKVVYALGYALPFDVYLIDERAFIGNGEFKEQCFAMLEERAKTAGVLFATSDARAAKRYCESAFLIADRKLIYYPDLEEGLWHLANLARDAG